MRLSRAEHHPWLLIDLVLPVRVCSTYHVIHTQKICCTAIVAFRIIMSRSITAVPKDVLIPRRTSLVLCSFGHTHDDVKVHHVQGASVGTESYGVLVLWLPVQTNCPLRCCVLWVSQAVHVHSLQNITAATNFELSFCGSTGRSKIKRSNVQRGGARAGARHFE